MAGRKRDTDRINPNLVRQLHQLMVEHGLSQRVAAGRCQVSATTVHAICNHRYASWDNDMEQAWQETFGLKPLHRTPEHYRKLTPETLTAAHTYMTEYGMSIRGAATTLGMSPTTLSLAVSRRHTSWSDALEAAWQRTFGADR